MPRISHPEQIGALLAARRKALDFSQADVGKRIALSQNRISELESLPGTLTVVQLLKLLDVLGLELQVDVPAL
ncbi:MAG TPA: helix-turn-helix domain-containing protein [Steroidobacteraceae bacterium]|jgi:HTH-type transcriptional regulator/antitoxin HipB|nr:helix-turn-helix domain-containing protein [Steroidobacteraceae bacterium]